MPKKYAKKFKKNYAKKTTSLEARLMKKVKRLLDSRIQDKSVTYTFTNNVGTAGVVLPIGSLTKGDNQYQRQASVIRPKHMHIRGHIKGAETQSDMRVIMGVYKPVQGALPSVAQILGSVDLLGNVTQTTYSSYNQFARENVIIKYDRIHKLSGFIDSGASDANINTVAFNKRIKLSKNIIYSLTGNAGTVADINNNMPFILLLPTNNVNLPTYDIKAELVFEDA